MPPPDDGAGPPLLTYPNNGNPIQWGTSYTRDGIPISRSDAMELISRLPSGNLSLLYMSAAASRPRLRNYEVENDDGVRDFGLNRNLAMAVARETGGTLIRNWLVSAGWNFFSSLIDTPQNSGFLTGRFGFSASEQERLGRAYDKIISDACRKFFDETLARMKKNGEIRSQYNTTPSTLAGVMAITTLNRYSSNLTAGAVGISQQRWDNIRNNFETGGAAGVTLGGDGRVFLGDRAFYQPGSIAQMLFKAGDLPGTIVHEFFHRAGLNEQQLKALNPDIQKHCGNPKDAL